MGEKPANLGRPRKHENERARWRAAQRAAQARIIETRIIENSRKQENADVR